MKKILFILVLIPLSVKLAAQPSSVDSLKNIIANSGSDSARVWNMSLLSNTYRWRLPDSSRYYAEKGLDLAKKIGYKEGELYCLANLSGAWWGLGEYETSIMILLPYMGEINQSNNHEIVITANVALMSSYRELGDYQEALRYIKRLDSLRWKTALTRSRINISNEANLYLKSRKADNARILINTAFTYPSDPGLTAWPYIIAGDIFKYSGNYDSAFYYYHLSIPLLELEGNTKDLAVAYIQLADLFNIQGNRDSARTYASLAVQISNEKKFAREYLESLNQLAASFGKSNSDSALHYLTLANAARDSLFSIEKQIKLSSFRTRESLRQKEIENAGSEYRSRVEKYILAALVAISLLIGMMLWRNNRNKQRANELLQFQKLQTETALEELKAAQAQLIQSEKMASLGELTAGIAHEIQNPLNFVNNFSQLNTELVVEAREAISTGNLGEAEEVLGTVLDNEQKVLQHGKRAEAIVKAMLQHSHSSSGVKEPTDLNKLADEYLRLAYHGMKARDKSFNSEFVFKPDLTLGKLNVVPQDMGRVLLNLINNAFYASSAAALAKTNDDFKPLVEVSTARLDNAVVLIVKDNGNGIPDKIKDKIFQPFFTTKPTGEGTGLGLSLSYDIIKAHGGEIKVESKEAEGTKFVILLPGA